MITLGFICAESKICSTIKKSQNIINMVADSSLISLSFFGSLDFFSFVLQFCRILTVSKLCHFVFNIFKFWIIFVSSFFSYNLCLQMVYQWARITLHSLPNDSEKNVSLVSQELLKKVVYFLNFMILYHQNWWSRSHHYAQLGYALQKHTFAYSSLIMITLKGSTSRFFLQGVWMDSICPYLPIGIMN